MMKFTRSRSFFWCVIIVFSVISITNFFFSYSPTKLESIKNISNAPGKLLTNTTSFLKVSPIRILCWVLTMPSKHETHAKAVKETWGSRCDKLLFISSKRDDSLPAMEFGIQESRDSLWAKTRAASKFIYENYINDYHWFLKADDDSFIIVENLRYLLYPYETDVDRIVFGDRYKHESYLKQGFVGGGAGYVLSRIALKEFVEIAMPNSSLCNSSDTWSEDVEMSKCLENIGVRIGESRDSKHRGRFFMADPMKYLIPGEIPAMGWYRSHAYYPLEAGPACCSDLAISFHNIAYKNMYVLDYLIYTLHHNRIRHNDPAPTKV